MAREMIQIGRPLADPSLSSLLGTPNLSPSSAMRLNSPAAKSDQLPSGQALTMDDPNQLNAELTRLQLSAEKLQGDQIMASEDADEKTHDFGDDDVDNDRLDGEKSDFDVLWELGFPVKIASCTVEVDANVFSRAASVNSLPALRRDGGVPLFSGASINNTPCVEVNKTPLSAVNGEVHGRRDNSTMMDVPLFDRDEWEPMGRDCGENVDLSPYLHGDTSFDMAAKEMSRL